MDNQSSQTDQSTPNHLAAIIGIPVIEIKPQGAADKILISLWRGIAHSVLETKQLMLKGLTSFGLLLLIQSEIFRGQHQCDKSSRVKSDKRYEKYSFFYVG